jgi:hypothetical protein
MGYSEIFYYFCILTNFPDFDTFKISILQQPINERIDVFALSKWVTRAKNNTIDLQ